MATITVATRDGHERAVEARPGLSMMEAIRHAGSTIADPGHDKVRMPKPVFIGDTLRAESEVTWLMESRLRPRAGTFRHVILSQPGEIVCQCVRMALLTGRAS